MLTDGSKLAQTRRKGDPVLLGAPFSGSRQVSKAIKDLQGESGFLQAQGQFFKVDRLCPKQGLPGWPGVNIHDRQAGRKHFMSHKAERLDFRYPK